MEFLYSYFKKAAADFPSHTCLLDVNKNQSYSYAQVLQQVQQISSHLQQHKVSSGQRVALWLPKTPQTVACILAVTSENSLYMPVDFESPAERIEIILHNCLIHHVLSPASKQSALQKMGYQQVAEIADDVFLYSTASHSSLSQLNHAFILNTSGSTGVPKPVLISHKAATVFINWACNFLQLPNHMVFASVAPFHFDLSVFDLYVAFKTGGSLCLFNAQAGKNPLFISEAIQQHKIEVLYATPTTYKLILAFGKLTRYVHTSLKKVIYAGEVFSVEPLGQLMKQWKSAAFYNFYGPTETNVCTAYALPADIGSMTEIPIGKPCDHMRVRLEKTVAGRELWVTGEGLMEGYFNDTLRTLQVTQLEGNIIWYCTGDLVHTDEDGNLFFESRNDRMIKRYGYRIEPGEVENAALKHSNIKQATVFTVDIGEDRKLVMAWSGSATQTLELKDHFVQLLPSYMVPDDFLFLDEWPVTSSGKTDVFKLREMYVATA